MKKLQNQRVEITIGNSLPAIFVGEVLYEGLGENGAGKKVREIKLRGYWENKNQKMTITFSSPLCKWKKFL